MQIPKTLMATRTRQMNGKVAEDHLYRYVNVHRDLSLYEVSKKLGWTLGKVQGALKRLEKAGLVSYKEEMVNGRKRKIIHTVSWKEMMKKEDLEELDKLMKRI